MTPTIVLAIAILVAQAILFGMLAVQWRERRRVATALADADAQRQLVADAPVMIWRSGLDKRCDFFNSSWLRFTGRTLAQELGDGWAEGVHPQDVDACVGSYVAAFDAREPFRLEYRLRRADGVYRWVLDIGVPRTNGTGQFAGYIGCCFDITDRKHAEQALEEAHTELTRVSRLTALGEFAAALSHELRQPLTAIIMSARASLQRLGATPVDVDEVKAGLNEVIDAGHRAEAVIQHNRQLFRQHTVEKAPLDVNAVIREALALTTARLREQHVTVVTALAAGLPAVNGDRIELTQVLLNLVANAIDAMERVDRSARRITVTSARGDAQTVHVAVSDTGVGLAGVDVEKMFTLSYTTKASGTGVGLSISRSIIQAHSGRLWAEENPQGGATFTFSLPVQNR